MINLVEAARQLHLQPAATLQLVAQAELRHLKVDLPQVPVFRPLLGLLHHRQALARLLAAALEQLVRAGATGLPRGLPCRPCPFAGLGPSGPCPCLGPSVAAASSFGSVVGSPSGIAGRPSAVASDPFELFVGAAFHCYFGTLQFGESILRFEDLACEVRARCHHRRVHLHYPWSMIY